MVDELEISKVNNSPEKELLDDSFISSSEQVSEEEVMNHVDLSFLLNHSVDELETDYVDKEKSLLDEEITNRSGQIESAFNFGNENNVYGETPLTTVGGRQDESNQSLLKSDDILSFLSDDQTNIPVAPSLPHTSKKCEPTEVPDTEWQGFKAISQEEVKENYTKPIFESHIKQGNYHSARKKRTLDILRLPNILQIGLDIGVHNIKYVIAKKQKSHGQILAFGILSNPLSKEQNFEQLIDYLVDELDLNSNYPNIRIACNINGQQVGLKRNTLPNMNKKMMRDAILWSAKKEFGLEDVPALIDYISLGKIEKKGIEHQDLLIIACNEILINQKMEPLLAHKMVPFKITPSAITLWQAYKNSMAFDQEKTIVLIDMGASKTTIAFVNKGLIEFAREIPTGGKDITEALTGTIFYDGQPYQFDTHQAEIVKKQYGFPGDGLKDCTDQKVPIIEYAVLMRPILERLGNEIQRSIDYYRENFAVQTIDYIYILGGTSQLKNLIPFLSEFIEPAIDQLPMPEKKVHNLNDEDYLVFQNRFEELSLAYNLATDFNRKLNLLPKSILWLEKFKIIRRYSFYVFLFCLILLGMTSGFSFLRSYNFKNQFQFLQLEYAKLEPLKQKYDSFQQKLNYLQNKKGVYTKELILDNPLPNTLKIIANLFPANMSLTNLNISYENGTDQYTTKKQKQETQPAEAFKRVVRLFGVCYHPSPDAGIQIADYMLLLQKNGLFKNIGIGNQHYREEIDQLEFEIFGTLNE